MNISSKLFILSFLTTIALTTKGKSSSKDYEGSCLNDYKAVLDLLTKIASDHNVVVRSDFHIESCHEHVSMKSHKVDYVIELTNDHITCHVNMTSRLRNFETRQPLETTQDKFIDHIKNCNRMAEEYDEEMVNHNRIEVEGPVNSEIDESKSKAEINVEKLTLITHYVEFVISDLLQGKVISDQNVTIKTTNNEHIKGGIIALGDLVCELYVFYLPLWSSIVRIDNHPTIVYKGAPKNSTLFDEMPENMTFEHPNCADVLGTPYLKSQLASGL